MVIEVYLISCLQDELLSHKDYIDHFIPGLEAGALKPLLEREDHSHGCQIVTSSSK